MIEQALSLFGATYPVEALVVLSEWRPMANSQRYPTSGSHTMATGNRLQLEVRAIIYRRLFLAETIGTLGMTTPPSAELGALRSFSFWDRRELNFLLGETSLP